MKNTDVKITERGWQGHYWATCSFTRNTLIEYNDVKIIVSTIGNRRDEETKDIIPVDTARYYETMCFYSSNDEYDDIDARREIHINSKDIIGANEFHKITLADIHANNMHEDVVAEMVGKLVMGKL